jgi:uncharacterized membrane protein (UPF0127 family)
VPIDVAFIAADGRVVAMHTMDVPPEGTDEADLPRYSSKVPVTHALEVAGGHLRAAGVTIGSKVKLPQGLRGDDESGSPRRD